MSYRTITTIILSAITTLASANPPQIITQPETQEIPPNSTARFKVNASGTEPLTFQWRFNGIRLPGANGAELVLNNISAADVGAYTVDVSNAEGLITSQAAQLSLFIDDDSDGLSNNIEQGDKLYQLIEGKFNWHQAKVDAESKGGHLAVVTSQQEWEAILALVGNKIKGKEVWLGGTDEGTEGVWKWVTGEPFTFQRWNAGEPNNVGNEDYVHILATRFSWNDSPLLPARAYLLEMPQFSNPNLADTDFDGLTDYDEVKKHSSLPNSADSDGDSLSDLEEILVKTNPMSHDTDGDQISDADEIKMYQTNPVVADSDGDGLSDSSEVLLHKTNPWQKDSDEDGHTDSIEIYAGKNPIDKNESPAGVLNVFKAVEIEFFPAQGKKYQIQVSEDLQSWSNFGEPIEGNGDVFKKTYTARGAARLFYRVELVQ